MIGARSKEQGNAVHVQNVRLDFANAVIFEDNDLILGLCLQTVVMAQGPNVLPSRGHSTMITMHFALRNHLHDPPPGPTARAGHTPRLPIVQDNVAVTDVMNCALCRQSPPYGAILSRTRQRQLLTASRRRSVALGNRPIGRAGAFSRAGARRNCAPCGPCAASAAHGPTGAHALARARAGRSAPLNMPRLRARWALFLFWSRAPKYSPGPRRGARTHSGLPELTTALHLKRVLCKHRAL